MQNCLFAQKGNNPIMQSSWVYPGVDGHLIYKNTSAGDKIMDFSSAGYMGGGVKTPFVKARITLHPNGVDDSKSIQDAIDKVSKLPLVGNFRGAIQLSEGNYICSKPILISQSGIVIRGSGQGVNGSIILMKGAPHTAIVIGSGNLKIPLGQREKEATPVLGSSTYMTDNYVAAGANDFHVADILGFQVGDTILIKRPITKDWIHFMEMDNLVRDGKKQTWISDKAIEKAQRIIKGITGNKITIDIPLPDSYDTRYLGSASSLIQKVSSNSRIHQVGIENLRITCPALETDYGHAPYSGIRIGADDCWVKDVDFEETMNTTVLSGNHITMENVYIKHSYTNLGASKPTDFSLEGSGNLINRCKIDGGNTYFVWTSSLITGPNVLLNCTFRGIGSRIQPHQRWSTGLLVDNCSVPDGGIDFMNRGVAGSGHGWTMGWAVAWNCIAKTYIIQNPPGAFNWAIGCIGNAQQTARLFDIDKIIPNGIFENLGNPVKLQSLYLAQLAEKKGMQALYNIGYHSNSLSEFTNKHVALTPVPRSIDNEFGEDFAFHRPVNTNNYRNNDRNNGPEKALDGNTNTYWTVDDQISNAKLEIDMEGPVEVDALRIAEAQGYQNRVREYIVEGQVNSDWKLLTKGTTIENNKTIKFPKTTVWKVRLIIEKTQGYPAISNFSLYNSNANPVIK